MHLFPGMAGLQLVSELPIWAAARFPAASFTVTCWRSEGEAEHVACSRPWALSAPAWRTVGNADPAWAPGIQCDPTEAAKINAGRG
jgi:hypothetical protein